jgi:hypothetical protein
MRQVLTTKKHILLIEGLKTFKSIFLGSPQTTGLMAHSIYSWWAIGPSWVNSRVISVFCNTSGFFCTFQKKYRTFEITSGIIFKMNLPLYKGFTLEIINKWWPLTTLNKWPLYRIKIYSKMHRESTKVTIIQRWPLRQVWLYIVATKFWVGGKPCRDNEICLETTPFACKIRSCNASALFEIHVCRQWWVLSSFLLL